MADPTNPNEPSATGSDAQALDDLTVLQHVQDQNMGESRLNVARPTDVSDTTLGNLANVQQGSTSNPQVHDVGGITTGVNVALDVAIESGKSGTVAPPTLDSTPVLASDDAGVANVVAQGVTPLNVQVQADLAEPEASFKPQELSAGQPSGNTAPSGVVTGGVVEAPVAEEVVVKEVEQQEQVEEAVNHAPVILDAESVSTNQEGTVTGRISASDPDGDALTFHLVDSAGNSVDTITNDHGTITIDPVTGQYTFIASEATRELGLGENVTDLFQVQVSDSQGASASQSFNVTVDGLNDGPVTSDVTLAGMNEDGGSVTFTKAQLLSNATDIDGDTLSVTDLRVDNGSLVENADGTYTFTPGANFNGEVSVSYTVDDGHGGTAVGSASLDVAAVADQADISAPDVTVTYGGANTNQVLTGTAGADTLVGGGGSDTLTGGGGNDTLYGDAAQAGGPFIVPLNIDARVTVNSESMGSITLSGLPDGAVLSAGTQNEDGSWTLAAGDLDGLTATVDVAVPFSVSIAVETIDGADTAITTSSLDVAFNNTQTDGNDVFRVVGNDGSTDTYIGGGGTDTITGAAGWSNDVIRVDNNLSNLSSVEAIDGGSAYDTILAGSGNDTLDFSDTTIRNVELIDGGAGNDTITGSAGSDTIMAGAGNDTGIVIGGQGNGDVYDGGTGTDAFQVNLTSAQYTTAVHQELQDFQAFVANPANTGKTFHFDSLGVDAKNWESLKVVVDGNPVSLENPPIIADAPGATTANDHSAAGNTIAAVDSDPGDTVTYHLSGSGVSSSDGVETLTTDRGSVALDTATGEYTFTPNADAAKLGLGSSANDSFQVVATDNHGVSSSPSTVNVTITGSNDGPTVAISGTGAGNEDTVIRGAVTGHDIDAGDTMAYHVAGGVSDGLGNESLATEHGTVSLNTATGEYTFSPAANWAGNDSFSVTVSDGHGGSVTQSVAVHVDEVADQASVAVSLGVGTVDTNGSFTVTNLDGEAGYHNTYGYYVMDDNGNPVSGEVIWADTHANVNATATISGVDPDHVGFFIIPNGQGNNSSLANGADLTFTKDASGNWQAVDAGGHALSGTGTKVLFDNASLNSDKLVHVEDTSKDGGNQNWEDLNGGGDRDYNDTNITVAWNPVTITETHPLTVSVNFPDMDGSETHAVKLAGLPAGATLIQDGVVLVPGADGSYTLDASHMTGLSVKTAAGFSGDIGVTVTATSIDGDSVATATASSATVHDDLTNHGPVAAASVSLTDTANTVLSSAVAASDADGDSLNFSLGTGTSGPQHGSVVLQEDGSFTYTPTTNYVGNDSFKVVISDGHGGTTTETISVSIAAPNHAPVIDAANTTATVTIDYSKDNISNIGQVAATDADGNDLTYSVANGGTHHGSLVVDADSGDFFYNATDTSWTGVDTFTVNVSDGHGGTTSQNISVNVKGGSSGGGSSGGSGGGKPIGWGDGGGRDESWGANGSWTVGGSGGGKGNNGIGNGEDGAPPGDPKPNDSDIGGDVTYATDDGTNWGNGWYAYDSGNPGGAGTGDRISSIADYNRHNEVYRGDEGDTLIASEGKDYLSLDNGSGKQMISGFDHIQLGDGEAVLDMTTPNMDYGDLTVAGGTGHDVIWSASGDDLLVAGNGGNTIHGGAGDDTIVAGAGSDNLMGQNGDDTFLFDFGAGHDVVNGGAGANWTDTLDLSTNMHDGATITISTGGHDWTVASDGDHLAANTIQLGQDKSGSVTIHSNQGDETIEFSNIESIKY
ncbi:MAG: tandem-95 repeat protein [Phaeospirillum sp.]|nr:tandem-95 repeat protein [Phaeospirillum sp.]